MKGHQGRNSSRIGTDTETTEGYWLLAYLACFFITPSTISPGVVLSTVSWPSQSRKWTSFSRGNLVRDIFPIEVPSPKINSVFCQIVIKLVSTRCIIVFVIVFKLLSSKFSWYINTKMFNHLFIDLGVL